MRGCLLFVTVKLGVNVLGCPVNDGPVYLPGFRHLTICWVSGCILSCYIVELT